ncbi:MAG: hypothetical protein V7746_06165 [Halioglobus sp.]
MTLSKPLRVWEMYFSRHGARQLPLPAVQLGAGMNVRLTIIALIVTFLLTLAQYSYAQCDGLVGVRAYFAPGQGPEDITGLRYKFHVADNNQTGPGLKILFGGMRVFTPGAIDTYFLESNLYTRGLHYSDPTCTSWPLLGTLVGSESSLRFAVPDYVGLGKTGAKTFSPLIFPRQSYLIDGLPYPKTDAISQLNLNQTTTQITITRGGLVSDKTGWKCVDSLDSDEYRQWDMSAIFGAMTHDVAFALPDNNARFITNHETLFFNTEFYQFPGLFKVYLWDFQFMRHSTGDWEPLVQWIITHHCGNTSAYGVRLASFGGQTVMEISNDGPGSFIPEGTIFELGLHVTIDIKPGSDNNKVNLKSKGVIPLAILTTNIADGDASDFDATQVDAATIKFGPNGASIAHGQWHVEDVEGDGDSDLILHFRTQKTGIACGDTDATLTGKTFGGVEITSTDAINTIGCK